MLITAYTKGLNFSIDMFTGRKKEKLRHVMEAG